MPSRKITPTDSSFHRPKLIINRVLFVNSAWAVRESQYFAALIIPCYFADETFFENNTCPEAPSGTGWLLGL